MLSTTSLQAFSGSVATGPVNQAGPATPVRLVRSVAETAPRDTPGRPATPSPGAAPSRPGAPPPRGSLLNIAV